MRSSTPRNRGPLPLVLVCDNRIGTVYSLRALLPSVPFQIAWPFATAALLFSAAIGLLAGISPAARAARLDPIEALRAE